MKTRMHYLMLLVLFLLAGCSNEEEWNSNRMNGNYTLKASIEDDNTLSRTTVNDAGQVLWVADDRIGVFGNQNTKNEPFTLTGGIGETSGTFKGNLPAGEEAQMAYYPYTQDVELNGNTLTFTLPSEYTYTGNSNAPMLAMKGEDGNFRFRHLAGLLKIIVCSVPSGVSKFVIRSEGDNAPDLAGKAEVADIQGNSPILELTGGGHKTITYDLKDVTESQLTFFVPLPEGTYPKLHVELIMEDGSALVTNSLSDIYIARAHMISLPVLEPGSKETVSPDYVPIDWSDGQTIIQNMNVAKGEFTLAFNSNEIPEFEDGKSIVVLQTDTSAYLKRIMSSSVSGNKVSLKTMDATMEEMFRNTEFTLSIGEGAQTKLITSQGNVIKPSKIVQVYEDNSYDIVYDETCMTKSDYTEINPMLPIPLYYRYYSGQSVGAALGIEDDDISIGMGASLKADTWVQSLTNTLSMYFKFSPAVDEKKINEHLKIKISEIEKFNCATTLNLLDNVRIDMTANGTFKWSKKNDKLAPPLYHFLTFMIGPVPVYFRENVDLVGELEFGIDGEVTAQCGYRIEGSFSMGFDYKKGQNISPEVKHKFDSEIYPFESQFNASINGKMSLYPEIKLKLYDSAGPTFALIPYVEGKLELPTAPYSNLSSSVNMGLNAEIGTELTFLNLVKFENSATWDLIESEVYRNPKKVELSSPTNGAYVDAGEPTTVEFVVTGELKLPFSESKSMPTNMALVQFQGTGMSKVNKEYDYTADDGTVQVEWTPIGIEDELKAIILDQNGEILDSVKFTPTILGGEDPRFEVLKKFYETSGGDNWTVNQHWLKEGINTKYWYGVRERYGQDNVFDLDLDDNNLTGNPILENCDFINDIEIHDNPIKSLTLESCYDIGQIVLPGNGEDLRIAYSGDYSDYGGISITGKDGKIGNMTISDSYYENVFLHNMDRNMNSVVHIDQLNLNNMLPTTSSTDLSLRGDDDTVGELNIDNCRGEYDILFQRITQANVRNHNFFDQNERLSFTNTIEHDNSLINTINIDQGGKPFFNLNVSVDVYTLKMMNVVNGEDQDLRISFNADVQEIKFFNMNIDYLIINIDKQKTVKINNSILKLPGVTGYSSDKTWDDWGYDEDNLTYILENCTLKYTYHGIPQTATISFRGTIPQLREYLESLPNFNNPWGF